MMWNKKKDEKTSEEQEQEQELAPGQEVEGMEGADVSEDEGVEEVAGPEDVEEEEGEPVEEKVEPGRFRRFLRKALIWLVVIVLAFGAGVGTFYFVRFQPTQERLSQQRQAVQEAQDEIADLESEVDRLSAFEERNQELQQEIDDVRLHITILSARSSVSDALLALSEENIAEAKLELDKVGQTLETLKDMLNQDQVDVVNNMLQRHELIMEELDRDAFSARSDLEVLSSKLGSLENTLFASP